jgi:hypothetical protein
MTTFKRSFLVTVILLALGVSAFSVPTVPDNLIKAIHQQETGGKLGPITGDNGKALGPFQIHYNYWKDSGVPGSYSQCADYNYSVRVINAYMQRFAPEHLKRGNLEALARVHNGGPEGYTKRATLKYWREVRTKISA